MSCYYGLSCCYCRDTASCYCHDYQHCRDSFRYLLQFRYGTVFYCYCYHRYHMKDASQPHRHQRYKMDDHLGEMSLDAQL